ncbi:MAG: hypothetical protein ACREOG_10250 [Gemmatimonadaceae bacterium]
MSHDDPEILELNKQEQRLFSSLPRQMPLDQTAEERLVAALRAERFFEQGSRRRLTVRLVAAAALFFVGAVAGGIIGNRMAPRGSLEAQLARDDLTIADRVLLLQRAGSAYVRAAHAYADATAKADSTAVEVARQVLLGAAHAIVRNELDQGVAARLTRVLQTPTRPASQPASPLIWF